MGNKLPEYDVLMFGLTRSDFPLSSVSLALAREWAKTNRVFYIDRPFSLKDIKDEWQQPGFKERLPALFSLGNPYKTLVYPESSYTRVTPLVNLPINFLPEGPLFQNLNKLNSFLVQASVQKLIHDYKIKNYVWFNSFLPVTLPVLPSSVFPKPLANVYQSMDEMSQEPYIARHGVLAEKLALKCCDLAVATSTALCEQHELSSGRKVHLMANAADFSLFENAMNKEFEMPVELKENSRKVIIYTGHYSDLRLDHELVRKICARFPEALVLFVGTFISEDLAKEGLLEIPNLKFTGNKPIDQLPAYLRHSHVAIIPYKKNELTKGIYPLKINEYLAAGIPVVSTRFSKDIAAFDGPASLADSHEQFLMQVDSSLNARIEHGMESRIQTAQLNTWRKRIETFEAILENYLETKP
ncbi:MAG: glycosyltransferase [Bacteroidetes bacterium]|nr:glycosyltransferase [Bacteroidota bacterium]